MHGRHPRPHRAEGHHRPDPRQPQDPCRRRSGWRCARSTSSPRAASRRCASTIAPAPIPTREAPIDIMAGLPELRRDWIRGRGDVEEVRQREVRPEDNGQLGPDRSGGVQPFPNVRRTVAARQGRRQRQPDALCPPRHHHARDGICRGPRESRPRRRSPATSATARISAPRSPITSPPNSSATKSPAAARSSPTTSTTPKRADGDRPQLPGQDQRQYRQQRGRLRRRRRGRQDGLVDPLGRRHGHGPLAPAATSTTPANGSSATAPCRSAPCRSTRRWRRSAASPRT